MLLEKMLIADGAFVNARDRDGKTALMWAVDEEHLQTVVVRWMAKNRLQYNLSHFLE